MEKQTLNIAFAGLRHGHIFELFRMATENPLYNFVGAFEEDESARENAENNGVSCRYKSYDELLCDGDVDVVALGGYYGQRGQMAIAALKAGKNVIADKPLCTDIEELYEIERIAKEKNLFVSCMFTMRFEKKIVALKKLMESGALGEINNVYFGGQHPLLYGRRPMWYFEDGKHGGVINDIAIHGIDAVFYALGLEVKEILSSRCWNKFADKAPQFKDSAQFMLVADNNAGILADVSYAIPDGVEFALPYYWQFYIWGTKGTVSFALGEEKSYYYIAGKKEPILLEEQEQSVDYLTDFYNVLDGKGNVILPMQDVFKATAKTLQIQQMS